MRNKLLTISIAAYNKQDYIRECLDTLLIPDILDDIEVFIIDDGGTDGTFDIAKEYENKYPNTFNAIHKENGGYGSTVNYSISNAHGLYFKLLDGDDKFDKNGLELLIATIKNDAIIHNVDVIFNLFTKFSKNKEDIAVKFNKNEINKTLDIDKIIDTQGFPMHTITYRTEILKKSGLKLRDRMLYTDNYYVAVPFREVKKVLFKDFVVYNYRQCVEGQSITLDSYIKNIETIKDISYDLSVYFNSIAKINFLGKKYMMYRIASTCVDYFATLAKTSDFFNMLRKIKKFDKKIRSISIEIFETMPMVDRFAAKILKFVRILYFENI